MSSAASFCWFGWWAEMAAAGLGRISAKIWFYPQIPDYIRELSYDIRKQNNISAKSSIYPQIDTRLEQSFAVF